MDSISFIIVNYNLASEIIECVKSIRKKIISIKYEIIIVDNCSNDSDVKSLKSDENIVSNTSLYFLEENVGFGKACNFGAEKARYDKLAFLNPDTVILKDNFLLLEDIFSDPQTAVAGANVNSKKYSDWSAGSFTGVLYEFLNIFYVGNWLNSYKIYRQKIRCGNNNFEVDWVIGASLIIRKDVFVKLNGFDTRFFMFFEEVDLCRRVKASGFKIYYLPKFEIFHHGSASAGKNYYFFTKTFYKSKILYFNKYYSGIPGAIINSILYLQLLSHLILAFLLYPQNVGKSKGKLKAFKEMLLSYKTLEIS